MWEHSASYIFAAKDKVATWNKFADLPQRFLECFPDFRSNVLLVYHWVGLKTRDHDFVASLDFEENVSLRPYRDDHPGFACFSILSRFNQPTPLIYDLKAGDHRSLAYLSIVNPGWLPIFSSTGIQCTPYYPYKVKRQLGFDQDVLVSPQKAISPSLSLAPFIKSHTFAYWEGKVARVMIPGSHRLGFYTASMSEYW